MGLMETCWLLWNDYWVGAGKKKMLNRYEEWYSSRWSLIQLKSYPEQ